MRKIGQSIVIIALVSLIGFFVYNKMQTEKTYESKIEFLNHRIKYQDSIINNEVNKQIELIYNEIDSLKVKINADK